MGVVIALMMTLLLAALGGALTVLAIGETRAAAHHHAAAEALYAADAALEVALNGLAAAPDWSVLLAGGSTSGFVDGPPGGSRRTLSGALDLGQATNLVRCGRAAACTSGETAAVTAERPWGPNNPHWQLYAYGRLSDLLPAGDVESSIYVVVWVGDDPSECDGRADADGGQCSDGLPGGAEVVALLAHAYGAYGTRRAVQATVARTQFSGVRRVSWREVR